MQQNSVRAAGTLAISHVPCVNPTPNALGYSENDSFAFEARLWLAKTNHVRLVLEQTNDRFGVNAPQFGQLLHAVVLFACAHLMARCAALFRAAVYH